MNLLRFAAQNARREFGSRLRPDDVVNLGKLIERRQREALGQFAEEDPMKIPGRPCPVCGQWARRVYAEDRPNLRVFECPDAHQTVIAVQAEHQS